MNRIKELRLKKHLSQEQLAKAIGVKNNTISRYEGGSREPKPDIWQKLADFFGVTVPYLKGAMNLYIFSQVAMTYGSCGSFSVLAQSEDDAWKQIQGYIRRHTAAKPYYDYDRVKFVTDRNKYHVQIYKLDKKAVIPHYIHD